MVLTRTQTHRIENGVFVVQYILVGWGVWNAAELLGMRNSPSSPPQDTAPLMAAVPPPVPRTVLEQDLRAIRERDLRQLLVDPPRKEAPKEVTPSPPPPVKLPALQATFVERSQRFGLFADQGGLLRLRRVSDSIEGMEVVDIGEGSAVLGRTGQTFTVHVPQEKDRQARDSTRTRRP